MLGLVCLFVLTDKPAQASWLTVEQREWLTGRMEAEAAARKPVGHLSLWQLATNKYFLVMALVCSGASATGSVLSVWQPQLLKSFGLTNLQTGFVNAIPYGIATVLMVLWGRHSDKTGERRWHTAIPLLLAAGGFTALGLTGTAVVPTIIMVTCCLVGAYAFKGPFWALSASWLSASTLAAGLAGINAIANLIGGGLMVNVVGVVKERTGSFVLGMLPLALLCAVAAICVLVLGRSAARATDMNGEAMSARSKVRKHTITRRGVLAGMLATSTGAWAAGVEQAVPNSTGSAPPRLDAPAGACDCHHHIYDERFPVSPHWRQGFPPGATVADYRLLQRRLGTNRSVVVQPSTYGIDNRCLVDALGQLGSASRGVAVVDTDIKDAELRMLTDAGVRAIRVNFVSPQTWGTTTPEMLSTLAKRVGPFGWHVQILMTGDQIVAHESVIRALPTKAVIDHLGRIPQPDGIKHPAFAAIRRMLDEGRIWVKVTEPYEDSKLGPPYADSSEVARAYVQATPERILWGTDWPHPTQRGTKPDDALLVDLLADWAPDERTRRRILVENPAELFGF